jgi:hypothetical protein
MKTKLMIGLLSVLVFAGCTGFNQDPLKDASNAVKNGVDPSTKPDLIKALPPGSYSLVVPEESIVFKVGKTTSYTLQLKTYVPEYSYSFSIVNLADFPGATFDAASGTFAWNPPSTAISALKSHDAFDAQVKISAVSKFGGQTLESFDKVRFYVETDTTTLPSVKSVKFSAALTNPLMFEEGTSRDMTIYVEDLDGQDAAGMRPTLNFAGKLAGYVIVRSTRFLPALNQWEFEVKADLGIADLTKNMESAPLSMQIVNRLNKTSVPYRVDFVLLSKLGAPLTTFDNTTTFTLNTPSSIVFTIYDSQGESIPTLVNSSLPAGATINCEKSTRIFQQCRLDWTPTAIGSYTTVLEIETRSSSTIDTRPGVRNTIAIAYKVQ